MAAILDFKMAAILDVFFLSNDIAINSLGNLQKYLTKPETNCVSHQF